MKEKTKLIGKRDIAEGTIEFSFTKPAGFIFRAGQYLDLFLIKPPYTDAEGSVRTFSIASAPSDPGLKIASRIRDTAFKRVLAAAEDGLEVEINGPMGSFTLHRSEARPAIFLAGGIGITPFMSIITDATERKLPHRLYLFYSNRRPQDAPYLSELQAMMEENQRFTFISTFSHINLELIRKRAPVGEQPIYYIAGPLAMVTGMRRLLVEMGVSDDDIKTEEFAGY